MRNTHGIASLPRQTCDQPHQLWHPTLCASWWCAFALPLLHRQWRCKGQVTHCPCFVLATTGQHKLDSGRGERNLVYTHVRRFRTTPLPFSRTVRRRMRFESCVRSRMPMLQPSARTRAFLCVGRLSCISGPTAHRRGRPSSSAHLRHMQAWLGEGTARVLWNIHLAIETQKRWVSSMVIHALCAPSVAAHTSAALPSQRICRTCMRHLSPCGVVAHELAPYRWPDRQHLTCPRCPRHHLLHRAPDTANEPSATEIIWQ